MGCGEGVARHDEGYWVEVVYPEFHECKSGVYCQRDEDVFLYRVIQRRSFPFDSVEIGSLDFVLLDSIQVGGLSQIL